MSNSQLSRRAVLRSLLAVLASAAGGRALANDTPFSLAPTTADTTARIRARANQSAVALTQGNFKTIYANQQLQDRFYLFLQNVYRLYPENQFHQLIIDVTAEYDTDQEIYLQLVERIPEIAPVFSLLTYGLPALAKQKEEMARQSEALLGSQRSITGYLEIGTTGQYCNALKERIPISGPSFIVHDREPTYSPQDIIERGQLSPVGTYVPMGNYEPFDERYVPRQSVDLVTNFIGFHHAPTDRLDRFVQSIWHVLRPGGRLLLRDHNVDSLQMNAMAALAHDVFNAGLGIPWEENQQQVRNFFSLPRLEDYLGHRGFERVGEHLFQTHDPTQNALMVFAKSDRRSG